MEAIVVLVGFLGAGKTTFLREVVSRYLADDWQVQVILNDYQNALLDSQRFLDILNKDQNNALNGSCICCNGLAELRTQLNGMKPREKGITFIEANGTTDACALMEFLGVGLKEHYLPPIQVSIVNVKDWQKRDIHNQLEANQVQVSSLVVLNHTEGVEQQRLDEVKDQIMQVNPSAQFSVWADVDLMSIPGLPASSNSYEKLDHQKSHWASCSADLPDPMSSARLEKVLDKLPKSILRVKGCTRLDEDDYYSYFEKIPSQEAIVRPYRGTLVSGPKLLVVGPGSDPEFLQDILN